MSDMFGFSVSARAMFVTVLFVALLSAALASPAWAQQTFVVNSTGDGADADTTNSVCDTDAETSGDQCTLRTAIQQANATAGEDNISFGIPDEEPHTISPDSALPTVAEAVVIDGYTQDGSETATADGAATLKIELNGSDAGDASGITVGPDGGGSTVRGLVVNRFSGFGGIHLLSDDNIIEGNHIGTNVAGTDAAATEENPNASAGVLVDGDSDNPAGSSDNTIGGTDAADRNVISGNETHGVWIFGTSPQANPQAKSATGNVVLGNYVGTDASGTERIANGNPGEGFGISGSGVQITLASGNIVGGAVEGARNIVSGNGQYGVNIVGPSSNNKVQGNYIGTDASGTDSIANEQDGVRIENRSTNPQASSSGNVIGGMAAEELNVISGNNSENAVFGPANSGVFVRGPGTSANKIQGNYIGPDKDGAKPLENSERGDSFTGNGQFGVKILLSPNNDIGGPEEGAGNVISGNKGFRVADGGVFGVGVMVDGPDSTGNEIQGNYIGTDASGETAAANLDGVKILDAPGNLVGGTTARARNVISGNVFDGIVVRGEEASGNEIKGNYVGPDALGTEAIPNATGLGGSPAGVRILAPRTVVGGTEEGAGNVISGNGRVFDDGQLSGFGVAVGGLGISNPGALGGSVIQGNYIGTDKTGTKDLGNADCAVIISDVPDNLVGGTQPEARNVISGNGKNGVQIDSPNASGNEVLGNLIGTDETGAEGLGNDGVGVLISEAPGNTIGGAQDGEGNVISDSRADPGVAVIGEAASANEVLGNLIGTDETGTSDLGNKESGVLIENAPGNTIGGAGNGEGNVISANGGDGIQILGVLASENVVYGNLSGTDATGEAALGNFNAGVAVIDAPDNDVGGTEVGMGNVLSGNGEDGVYIGGEAASGNEFLGNRIGTDGAGTSDVGNERNGIRIAEASGGNTVGGSNGDAENVVAFSGEAGVMLGEAAGSENAILRNFILSNGGLGIDLGAEGVTPNDVKDPDTGPNGLQNYPVISGASIPEDSTDDDSTDDDSTDDDSTTVVGSLDSVPGKTFVIRFFSNSDADGSGFGEGKAFLGEKSVTTGSSGLAFFSFDFTGALSPDEFVTATSTDPDGNTSEFSNARKVLADETVSKELDDSSQENQTVSTGGDLSEDNPASTSVTIPAGTDINEGDKIVSITESSTVGQSQPQGFSLLGYEIKIEAPDATVDNPLEITFLLHESLIPAGADAGSIEVFRNGERVLPCADGSGRADPDPCVSVRGDSGGGVEFTVLTSSASVWNFGVEAEDRGSGDPEDTKACTIPGTPGSDVLKGTPDRDVICGFRGNDILRGFGGNDLILGGAGNDVLHGGSGKDVLRGERGNDRLNARDGVRGNDIANGGAGRDKCAADRGDVKRSCP